VLSLHVVRATRPKAFPRIALLIGLLAIAAVGGAILLMNTNELLRQRLSTIPQQVSRDKRDVRIYNWQAALDQIHLDPWLGTGAGSHIRYGRLFRRPQIQSDPIHAHNDYLELLAEYGIAGGLGMAAFLFAHLRSGWRNYRSILREELAHSSEWQPAREDQLALTIGALSAVVAYLVHSVSDFNLHVPGHALIFAFIFGTLAGPAREVKLDGLLRATMLLRWSLPPLALWVLIFAMATFGGEYWAEKARRALRDFQFSDSIKHAQKGLTFHDQNYELYFYLGGAHRGMALLENEAAARVPHLEAAFEAYAKCIALFPEDEHALTRAAQTLDDLGRFKGAEPIFQTVLQLDPKLAKAHANYARHLAVVGRHDEAEPRMTEARKLGPFENFEPILRGTSLDPLVRNR